MSPHRTTHESKTSSPRSAKGKSARSRARPPVLLLFFISFASHLISPDLYNQRSKRHDHNFPVRNLTDSDPKGERALMILGAPCV
eukprot:3781756-Rhodomonas_salina.1